MMQSVTQMRSLGRPGLIWAAEDVHVHHGTMRFGSTAKVLAECNLKYYRISECMAPMPPVQRLPVTSFELEERQLLIFVA